MSWRAPLTLPEDQRAALQHARWLEAVWLAFLVSIVVALYFVLGSSQAMKTAWIEDLLSFVPPTAFLAASWIEGWPPSDRFPLGFIRASSVAYLVSAVALAGVALFMIFDASRALMLSERPTIGSIEAFGITFWSGWLMIAVLAYSAILPVIFGRLKQRPAKLLHDKVLWADALMNKADWMTGLSAIAGIIGIGFGLWWADAVAAIVIALDVLHDGYHHTSAAIRDLIDETPRTLDDSRSDPLQQQLSEEAHALAWVRTSDVHLRQEGRYLTGTIGVVPVSDTVSAATLTMAEDRFAELHWRLRMVRITLEKPGSLSTTKRSTAH
jgi:divalent metal cation (Fe/Co/Zn/Cd) transporter